MASPLRLFRKYEYVFLVAFGIILMIAFVVGPILSDYLDTRVRSSHGGNPVVVTWKGGELNEADLSTAHSIHLLTTRFLRELTSQVEVTEDNVEVNLNGRLAILRKGRRCPVNQITRDAAGEDLYEIAVAGELVTVPSKAVRRITPKTELITQAPDEEELVRRMVLADKAKQQGVVVSEAAVLDYLDRLCDVQDNNRPDYAAMLNRSTSGRLDMRQFVGQMAMELSARRMMLMSQGGLLAVPPDVMYQCYNKLNRRVTAELLAVDVAGFLNQVVEPSAQDIIALYEEGKNRFPFPTSPDPGFKLRKKIAFGYLQGSYDEFLKREMDQISPTITDAEIEEHYAKNKDSQYTIPELPSAEPAGEQPSAGEQPKSDAAENAEAPTTEADKVDSPAGSTPPETPSAEPAGTTPTQPPATKEPPAAEPPAETSGQSPSESAPPEGAEQAPQTPPSDPAGSPEKSEDQTRAFGPDLTFVNFQEPEAAPGPAQEPTPPSPAEDSPPSPASETPAKTQPSEAPAATESELSPAEPAAGSAPPVPAPSVVAPAGEDAAPQVSPTGEATKEAPKKEVKYKPLDDTLRAEIREQLARNRARQPAQQNLEKAISQAEIEIQNYAKQLSRSKVLEGVEAPAPIDFAKIAQANHLAYQQTPLLDDLDVSQIYRMDRTDTDPPYYPFVRANERSLSRESGGIANRTIISVGFSGDLDLMVPRRMVDGFNIPSSFPMPPDNLFLFWRTEEQPERVPELDEVRDEVVRAWKMKQALPLAQEKAVALAKQAADATGESLADVLPESAKTVIRTTQFSWMTRGSMPGGAGGRPMLSPINGMADNRPVNVANAGNDFMAAVFALDVNQVGTATDEAHAFVYVVRIESEDLTDEQRREAFFASGYTPDVGSLVQEGQTTILLDWLEGVDKDFQVTWKRPPENNWRSE